MAASNGELSVRIDGVDGRLKGHDKNITELFSGLNQLRNRIPVWCVFLLMGLSSAVTGLLVALSKG